LQGVDFQDEIEFALPAEGRNEQIGGDTFDPGIRKTLLCCANGGLRNVEWGGLKPPLGELFCVIAEGTADDHCGFAGGLLPMRFPVTE
jgi:hypothetical protein